MQYVRAPRHSREYSYAVNIARKLHNLVLLLALPEQAIQSTVMSTRA